MPAPGAHAQARPGDRPLLVDRATVARGHEGRVVRNRIGDRDAGRRPVADVPEGDRVVEVARRPDRNAGVDLRDDERRARPSSRRAGMRRDRGCRPPGCGAADPGRAARPRRSACRSRAGPSARRRCRSRTRPMSVPGVQRVRVRRVEDERVDRRVRQVAADVRPATGRRRSSRRRGPASSASRRRSRCRQRRRSGSCSGRPRSLRPAGSGACSACVLTCIHVGVAAVCASGLTQTRPSSVPDVGGSAAADADRRDGAGPRAVRGGAGAA